MMTLPEPQWREYAGRALEEDRAHDDITTALLGEGAEQPAVGRFRAEADLVVAGLPLIEAVFRELDAATSVESAVAEGDQVATGATIAVAHGRGGVLLSGERVALNYLQRLSGIATVTRRAVDAVAGTGAVITDTRKTTPGLRPLEKYAVRIGGGENHRASLAEAVLWKDNHWELLGRCAGGLTEALRGAPEGVQVCVEVESERQVDEAVAAGVDWLLVDNQTPDTIASWSRRLGPKVTIEASGGITPETARPFAEAGAQRISIGALTYAPDIASVSFEIGLRS
jgi:nicotinate-nucleotide pyrophosphorylase (carboxylating)